MSTFYVPELNQVLLRTLVLAPTDEHLKSLFEHLLFELTTQTDADPKHSLNLATAHLPEAALSMWGSFNLGTRASNELRMILLGHSYASAKNALSSSIARAVDHVLLWAPPEQQTDVLLGAHYQDFLAHKPLVILQKPLISTEVDTSQEDLSAPFRLQAHEEWVRRKFQNYFWIPNVSSYFKEGLSWVLSF